MSSESIKGLFIIAIIVIGYLIIPFTDPKNAERVLSENGYTDIQITGYSFMLCGKDDVQHTGFIAKSINGSQVKGAVCSGLFIKGSTIRFD